MKLSTSITAVVALATSLATALPSPGAERRSIGSCWTGQIHSPCNNHTEGCTPDGIKVECRAGEQMVYASMCGLDPNDIQASDTAGCKYYSDWPTDCLIRCPS
ncbi:Uu.00g049020.m01.CDS01 [Anthostomella pinea]|uniref:Uu.00g049020.m01.CDS01 n=1 Tax=Anthostomella pinea TaxID=933095 RepID=A0AAI8YCC3_9PEZI|nr:Uu.00g049020.m01.CDS01 [Anthostomella pinea]